MKLKSLFELCDGNALDAIQFSMLLAPNKGLKSALEILKSRCGNPLGVVQAWIRNITRSPKLDSSNIRKFADDLDNCIKALTSLDCINEMDNQQSNRTIVEKLPRFTQHRWTKELDR
ncbi:hypothetical protein HOLleu_00482 [Holothuria leucospilota]|uniref:Uncharacterized protein n=1 Tax=Holothuria leucospilota TaxID=206669 RepID=A0A9Q1CMB0_HOLLE|nr:hypothetical protein HOLleu_00482 [Holothuria leucospilota]